MFQKQSGAGTPTKSSRALVFLLAVLLAGGALLTFSPASPASAASPPTGTQIKNVALGQVGKTCDQVFSPNPCPDPGEWCADFARWVWDQAGITNLSGLNGLASSFFDYGKNHYGSLSDTPAVGDAVVYSNDAHYLDTTIAHVGIVTSVSTSSSGTMITSVGGNENGIVQNDSYPYSAAIGAAFGPQFIAGYIRPAGVTNPAPVANGCPATLRQGDQGTWVNVAKFALNSAKARGVFSTSTPYLNAYGGGLFDTNMYNMLLDFQTKEGLYGGSGVVVVGDNTWSRLGFCEADFKDANAAGQSQSNCPSLLDNTSTSQVWNAALQDLLNFTYTSREYQVSPQFFMPYLNITGNFDAATQKAVVDYQYGVGLGSSGNGQVGNRTWSNLGMCY